MAEIVNLRSRRKAQQRLADQKTAEANRALHGIPKAERRTAERNKRRTERDLDGHRLDGRKVEDD